ncbi:MAG: hypothetical protein M5U24_03070 [Candidatus Kuenenia sp.]|uniref:hypothetical protein n=1 Tax=Candidatus Kuenenia sp. TaxID=2499824 RepID=UPI0022C76402|nr:hypothetical protein [Candidatus Kuenenia sp.]MCZ7621456.1 hypothetical protein [Candidatus Kuenenia sp.]
MDIYPIKTEVDYKKHFPKLKISGVQKKIQKKEINQYIVSLKCVRKKCHCEEWSDSEAILSPLGTRDCFAVARNDGINVDILMKRYTRYSFSFGGSI